MLPDSLEADYHDQPVVLDYGIDDGGVTRGGCRNDGVPLTVGRLLYRVAEPGYVAAGYERPGLGLGGDLRSDHLVRERALEPVARRVQQRPPCGRARVADSALPDLPEEYVVAVGGGHRARCRGVGVDDCRLCGVRVEGRGGVRTVDAEPVYAAVGLGGAERHRERVRRERTRHVRPVLPLVPSSHRREGEAAVPGERPRVRGGRGPDRGTGVALGEEDYHVIAVGSGDGDRTGPAGPGVASRRRDAVTVDGKDEGRVLSSRPLRWRPGRAEGMRTVQGGRGRARPSAWTCVGP